MTHAKPPRDIFIFNLNKASRSGLKAATLAAVRLMLTLPMVLD
jgi:hypothetical protein